VIKSTAISVLRARLKPYLSRREKSGVSAYLDGGDFIIVEFRHEHAYLYNQTEPGRKHVRIMKRLAAAGRDLTTYINQHVRTNYAQQLW
jgi:hypothetical protein